MINNTVLKINTSSSGNSLIKEKREENCIKHIQKIDGLVKAELKQFSLISNPILKKTFSLGSDSTSQIKNFASINGDTFIHETSLEGNGVNSFTTCLIEFLKIVSSYKWKNKEVSNQLEQLINDFTVGLAEFQRLVKCSTLDSLSPEEKVKHLHKEAVNLAQKVFNLKSGKRFIVFGGWVGYPTGHAMLYVFKKNENGTWDLDGYNSGSGVTGNHDYKMEEANIKYRPVVRYRGITKEELFFSNDLKGIRPAIFQAFIEPIIWPVWDQRISVEAMSIYAILNLFKDKRVFNHNGIAPAKEKMGFVKGQRSGTCVIKCELYFILDALSEFLTQEEWRFLKHEFKLQSVTSFHELMKTQMLKDDSGSSQIRNLAKAGVENLIGSAALKLFQKIHTEQQSKLTYATSKEVLRYIEETEKEISTKRKASYKNISLLECITENTSVSFPEWVEPIGVSRMFEDKRSVFPVIDYKIMEDVPNPEKLMEFLSTFGLKMQKLKKALSFSFSRYEFEHFIHSLPMPNPTESKNYWNKVPVEHLQNCLKYLVNVFYLYEGFRIRHMHKTPSSTPEQRNLTFSIYAMVHTLALRIDKDLKEKSAKLSDYGLYFYFQDLKQDNFCLISHPETYSRRQEILRYFSLYRNNPLYDFCKIEFINEESSKTAQLKFYSDLLKYSAVREHVEKKEKRIFEYRDHKIHTRLVDIAELLLSPNLLSECGYSHVAALFEIALLAHLQGGTPPPLSKEHHKMTVPKEGCSLAKSIHKCSPVWEIIVERYEHSFGSFNFFDETRYFNSQSMHSPFFLHLFRKKELEESLNLSEADFFHEISQKSPGSVSQLKKELLRHRVLNPSLPLILEAALENCIELGDYGNGLRSLFELMLFGESSIPSLRYHLEYNPSFVQQCKSLIEKGRKLFDELLPKSDPDVISLLFFIRLSLKLKMIEADVKKYVLTYSDVKEHVEYMKELLHRKGGHDTGILMHLIGCFACLSIEALKENKEALKTIVQSWQRAAHIKESSSPSLELDKHFENQIKSFYYRLVPIIKEQFDKDPVFCRETLLELNLDRKEFKGEITRDFPLYFFSNITFNLVTGQYYEDEKLNQIVNISHTKIYDKLLKNSKGSTFAIKMGDLKILTHRIYESVLIKTLKNKETIVAFIATNNVIFNYLSEAEIHKQNLQKYFPPSLLLDNALWQSSSKEHETQYQIHNQATGKPVAFTKKDKIFLVEQTDDEKVIQNEISSDYIAHIDETSVLFDILKNFAGAEQFYATKNEGLWSRIHISTYRFLNNDSLSFHFEYDSEKKKPIRLVWDFNSNFHLALTYQEEFFRSIPHLALADHEGKICKLIVILTPIEGLKPKDALSSEILVHIKDKCLLEFDLKEGLIEARETEGWLYLTNISMARNDPYQALKYLERCGFVENLSERSENFFLYLILLINIRTFLCTQSPNNVAFSLIALCKLLKIHQQPCFIDKIPFSRSSLEQEAIHLHCWNNYQRYIKLLNNVDPLFVLSLDNEKLINDFVKKEHRSPLRDEFIQKGFYPNPAQLLIRQIAFKRPLRKFQVEALEVFKQMQQISLSEKIGPFSITQQPSFDFFAKSFRGLFKLAQSTRKEDKNYIEALVALVSVENNHINVLIKVLGMTLENPRMPDIPAAGTDITQWKNEIVNSINKMLPDRETEKTFVVKIEENKVKNIIRRPMISKIMPGIVLDLKYDQYSLKEIGLVYFQQTQFNPEKEETVSNLSSRKILTPHMKPYLKAIDNGFNEYKNEYLQAIELGKKEVLYVWNKEKPLLELTQELQGVLIKDEKRTTKLEEQMLSLMNSRELLHDRMLLLAKVFKNATLSDLEFLFLGKDRSKYLEFNPQLTEEQIDQLSQWMGEYLLLSSRILQIARCRKWIEKCQEGMESNYLHKLAEELNTVINYNPNAYSNLLIFEKRSGLRLKDIQFSLFQSLTCKKNGKLTNGVYAFPMGGGKSSAIAPIFLYTMAQQPGRMGLFLVPSAQFETVKGNLITKQKNHFNQLISPFDLTREQMTLVNLKWLKKQLVETINEKNGSLSKPEFLLSLFLHYFHLQKIQAYETGAGRQDLIILRDILNIYFSKTDVLADEVDQILDMLKRVVFPTGKKEQVDYTHIELIKDIFIILTRADLHVDEKKKTSLLDYVGLKHNKQSHLSESDYHSIVKPLVIKQLFAAEVTNLFKDYETSFNRYLCKEMEPNLQLLLDENGSSISLKGQDKQDFEFISLLRKLSKSPSRPVIERIALTKYILNEVLTQTLSKSSNRHHGRQSKEHAKVVPYRGVKMPSSNDFGHYLEAICCQFQTGIFEGILPGQIKSIASSTIKQAYNEGNKQKITLDQTKVAKEFKEVTTLQLDKYYLKEELDKALGVVNKDISKIIKIEASTIPDHVSFYSSFMQASPYLLVKMFSSFQGVSGTVWNSETYHPSLSKNPHLKFVIDGKIAKELLSRAKKNPAVIHKVASTSPIDILKELLDKHPKRSDFRGIIDSGALFKDFDHQFIAAQILKYFEKDSFIEAVAFFSSSSDKVSVLQKNCHKARTIKGTDAEEINELGIDYQKCAYFYDGGHTDGIHFLQNSKAFNFITIDESLIKKQFSQGSLRLRELFLGQDLEYIFNADSAPSLNNEGKTLEDLLVTMIINQAIRKSKDIYRFFLDQMTDVVKAYAFEALINPIHGVETQRAIYKKYEKVIETQMKKQSSYELYGALDRDVLPMEMLEKQAQSLLEDFPNQHIKDSIEHVLKDAKESLWLPDKVPYSSLKGSLLGEKIEIQLENKVETRLDEQLEAFEKIPKGLVKKESPLIVNDFLPQLDKKTRSLKQLLELSFNKVGWKYDEPYSNLFDSNIFVTDNFSYSYTNLLPVFHPIQKPAHQILLINRKDLFEAHLLSLQEAAFISDFLRRTDKESKNLVWLCNPSGSLLIPNAKYSFPKEDEQVKKILLQVNLFNGNVEYLDDNKEFFTKWIGNRSQLAIKFLEKKTLYNLNQKKDNFTNLPLT